MAEAPDDREPEEVQGREVSAEDGAEALEEGIVVDWTDVALFLSGAGVMLVGFAVSPVVAWLWKRVNKDT